MPTKSTYYINGSTFANATAVFTDANLTTCAPDGFYSFGGIVREQVSCNLLPPTNCPSCEFICEWDTSNISTGSSSAFQVQLPVVPSGVYDYTIDWGDGVVERKTGYAQASQPHTYPTSGVYTTRITGTFVGWQFNHSGDRLKLLEVNQWGCFNTGNVARSFAGCANLTLDTTLDTMDTTGLTTLDSMFWLCSSLNPNSKLAEWDVSNITNFFRIFSGCSVFNTNINAWDVSSALGGINLGDGLHAFFQDCVLYNQPLNLWNVSGCREFNRMFYGATSFNQDISMWDTSSALDMKGMFEDAIAFNQPIGVWDTSSALDMKEMFKNATAFNQDIGSWNVGGVTDFDGFMAGKTDLNYSTANMDSILNGWIVNKLSTLRTISFGTIKRTAAGAEGRALLTRSRSSFPDKIITNVTNSAGLILVEAVGHGMSTGNKVFIYDVTGTTEANGLATITVVSPNEFTIDGSTFVNAYTGGGTVLCAYGWNIDGANL